MMKNIVSRMALLRSVVGRRRGGRRGGRHVGIAARAEQRGWGTDLRLGRHASKRDQLRRGRQNRGAKSRGSEARSGPRGVLPQAHAVGAVLATLSDHAACPGSRDNERRDDAAADPRRRFRFPRRST